VLENHIFFHSPLSLLQLLLRLQKPFWMGTDSVPSMVPFIRDNTWSIMELTLCLKISRENPRWPISSINTFPVNSKYSMRLFTNTSGWISFRQLIVSFVSGSWTRGLAVSLFLTWYCSGWWNLRSWSIFNGLSLFSQMWFGRALVAMPRMLSRGALWTFGSCQVVQVLCAW
jgi:hypothetical protein